MRVESSYEPPLGKLCPHLSPKDFDGYPHRMRGHINAEDWKPEVFPFDIDTLPRLPRIENDTHYYRAISHKSYVILTGEEDDPEPECLNSYETIGDSVLAFFCTQMLDREGVSTRSGDIAETRKKFISNVTFSYVSWAYRLHHLCRNKVAITHPRQKLMADLFEAYIGAAWRDHQERGRQREMEDWLFDFFDPRHWTKWDETVDALDRQQPKRDREKALSMAKTQRRRDRDLWKQRDSEETVATESETGHGHRRGGC